MMSEVIQMNENHSTIIQCARGIKIKFEMKWPICGCTLNFLLFFGHFNMLKCGKTW